ncbi:uncharacterized protein LOC100381670 [Zea mays]|uniref:RIN4 pathogenic type III effector avirulence factor Avr cleavage site domain-containing protein n=1 Tax=Zea mays TaxID=4577 RepID=C0HHY1_MAIZE|nr:uncharacterized protein LOC100381670 [Zea mays]ACN26634.1 unknown [Zea mays]AQK81911.1 hypothetical protein ZEAMMB73_Zm00001d036772 [Zea mays]|eukprot:NP_001167954.1 uncharacterized protein LOC100381670 [Zea mays]
MAKRPTVPKFGTWDSGDAGYTAYFDKVRENKGATAPPLRRPRSPNDPDPDREPEPEEGPMRRVPPPSSSRPATAGGHREPPPPGRRHGQSHRRTESSGSAPSDRQSKFAPPPQYYQQQQRASPQQQPRHHHGGGGGHQQQHPPSAHGHGHGHGHRAPHAHRQHHAAPGPRARSASPQSNAPRASAVPRFGVWDEQTASSAAQGFTVQFENVKRNREVARSGVPAVPRVPSPPEGAALRRAHQKTPFVSKMFGCFLPTTAKG